MHQVKTIEVDGTLYIVPSSFSDAKLSEFSGMLLMLRRLDYCCDKEYRKTFYYADADSVRVRLGTKTIHATEEEAKATRDAHNETLIANEAADA